MELPCQSYQLHSALSEIVSLVIKMSWIFWNTISHTVNVNIIELLWCTVETLSSMQYTLQEIYFISGALASWKF